MPKLTLNRTQVQEMAEFAVKHSVATFFLVKDDGAYVGILAKTGPQDQDVVKIIHYFKGCNPEKDEDWFDTQQAAFGGDDFVERFDVKILNDSLAEPGMEGLAISADRKSIGIDTVGRPRAASAAAAGAGSKARAAKMPAAKRAGKR